MPIPIEILKIKDPDGVERLRVVISFHDVVAQPSVNKQLIEIQNDYVNFINNCKRQLNKMETNRKNRGNPLLKWKLADTIYRFVKALELKGYIFANLITALSRDLGISVRYVNYLIEFRTTYPDIQLIHREICWDKYKELLDIPDISLRKNCIDKILKGELKTREDIRKFKKRRN
ncbi:MAG: hypothetical protein QXU48_03110 [Thermoplasmata archaeon]